jgi:hypothetical protein
MEVYGDLSDQSRREAESVATVLANIAGPRAFAALCEAWKNGLHTIDPRFESLGPAVTSSFLPDRSLIDCFDGGSGPQRGRSHGPWRSNVVKAVRRNWVGPSKLRVTPKSNPPSVEVRGLLTFVSLVRSSQNCVRCS